MTQPARLDEPRRHVVKKNVCAMSKTVLRVQIYKLMSGLQQESNLQPSVYKTDALPVELKRRLSSERDSNPRMSVLQTDTFTASPPERMSRKM